MSQQPCPNAPDLDTLTALFYDVPEELGRFVEVTATEMPADFQMLLAHEHHMTVTVERFHHSPVDVQVLQRRMEDTHYARKILLARQSDSGVVQFGIMRINFDYLDQAVQDEIRREQLPLGRILISHNVLRRVRLASLWEVTAGPDLSRMFNMPLEGVTYGRTALIECNGEPAVELIEIVTPITTS
jgi:chorismate-pyruvate lyase